MMNTKEFLFLITWLFLLSFIYQFRRSTFIQPARIINLEVSEKVKEDDILEKLKQELLLVSGQLSDNAQYQFLFNLIQQLKMNNIVPNLFNSSNTKVKNIPSSKEEIYLMKPDFKLYKFVMPFDLNLETRDADIQRLELVMKTYKRQFQPGSRLKPVFKRMKYGKKYVKY